MVKLTLRPHAVVGHGHALHRFLDLFGVIDRFAMNDPSATVELGCRHDFFVGTLHGIFLQLRPFLMLEQEPASIGLTVLKLPHIIGVLLQFQNTHAERTTIAVG